MQIDFSKVKGLILDYGGTLDSRGDHWSEIIWNAWQKAGIAADKPTFREAYVYVERELARTRHILPQHDFHDLLKIKMNIELQWMAENGHLPAVDIQPKAELTAKFCYDFAKSCIDEARPVLDQLKARFPMVLVSNFYGNIESVLSDFGIRDYFKQIIESSVVGIRKPDPRIFRLGVKALGLKPEETLVIGDSMRKDILPAESIGCMVIWLKGKGWTEEDDAQLHPNTISKLGDILEFFA